MYQTGGMNAIIDDDHTICMTGIMLLSYNDYMRKD